MPFDIYIKKKMNDLKLFQMLQHSITQFKRWHHYTTSYAEHMALGGFYQGMQALEDQFIEVYIGIHGRSVNMDFKMEYKKYSKGCSMKYLKLFVQRLYKVKQDISAGCLQNIIDEITALANKTIYLLTLN